MPTRKLGGRARLMQPAVAFAKAHDFAFSFTQGGHLAFQGHGGRVIAAGTPRSGRAALLAIQKMRALLRAEPGAARPRLAGGRRCGA